MNGIRVSGRKNSGINIDGFNSQGGVHSFCHCYNCCFLIDLSKDENKYRELLRTLELHALPAELKLLQLP